MRSLITNTLLLSTAGLLSTSVIAETVLQPVVVTATRHEQNLDDTLSSTTLITRKEIEASSATTLEELLMNVTGLDVIQAGAYGKNTSIYMRGTNSSHILTLVNGIKTYSATSGGTAFQHIPLSQIDRIEIVRGPRSGLYGSEALGGVIQIFTRTGQDKPTASFNIEQGSNNTSKIDAGFSGRSGKLGYSLFASQFDTDGIDSIQHATANDKDGYDQKSLSSNLSYEFNKTIAVNFELLNSQGSSLYDNCYNSLYAQSDNCYADYEQQSSSVKLKFTPQGIWDGSLQIGHAKDLSDNFWEDTANNTYLTEVSSLYFQNNIQLSENHLLVAGIDSIEDEVLATPYTVYDKTRDNQGAYLAWNAELGNTSVQTSVRSDDNEQFGTHATGSISAGYKMSNELKMFASYGTAFKAPTFNQLYWPGFSNPDLLPEESESVEIGIKQKINNGQLQVSLYNTKIDNLIVSAANLNKAEIDGIEFSANLNIAEWELVFSTEFIEPINKDTTNYGKILVNRTQQSTSLNASKMYGKTGVFISLLNQGRRFTDAANTNSLDSYTVVDLKLNQQIDKNMTTELKIVNVFDEDYLINGGFNTYNTLGRSVFISMNYKM